MDFNLPKLSPWYKKKYLAYATQVLQAQQAMSTTEGANILHYTLKDESRHEHMSHYPAGDRIDRKSGGQYFYHCHREDFETTEHGHFHCFLRYKYIPKYIKPLMVQDWDLHIDNPMTHLVAIAMNQQGMPIRLFSVNRWVTSEIWYESIHTPNFLKRFQLNINDNSYWGVLDKWVEGILHLFSPQISWLNAQRDNIIQSHQQRNAQDNVFLNKELEELSSIPIDLKKQIEWVIG